jgi:hypothetical protein
MRLTWHAKDLANTAALADAVGLATPAAETARRIMQAITVADVARLLDNGPLHEPDQVVEGDRNFPITSQ